MSYFLTLSGSSTKFSNAGILLRTIGSIVEKRATEFRVVHAVDLPPHESATRRIANLFIADTLEQIQQAKAIALVAPATKETPPALLAALLGLLPDNIFAKKPVLLFVTGGFAGHVALLEQALKPLLFRLGTTVIAARVHVGTGSWIIVGDNQPRLSRGAEREVAHAIDLVLGAINSREPKEFSLELGGQ